MAFAMPKEVIDIDQNNLEHEQEGLPGTSVTGEYTAVDANGQEYTVKYIADHLGFRVIDDENALPEFRDTKPDDMFVEKQA